MIEKWSKYMFVLLISIVFITACAPAEETDTEQESPEEEEMNEPVTDENDGYLDLADMDQQYDWAEQSIFYQIFVRSFYDADGDGVGDFAGIEQNLDYIQELGANALWLMPMKEAKSYHGYDVTDYYEVEGQYGTMEEFESLLAAAHERDMKVIIDFVVNHTSDEHPWFQEALADENSQYRDYYVWDDHESYAGQEPNGEQGWHEVDGQIYSGHFNVDMPDLNFDHPDVRQEVKDMASFWLEKGVDGFRIDAVADIYEDRNETIEWWREFNSHVKSVAPEAFIVGETWYHAWDDISYYYSALESNFNFVLTEEIIGMANGMNVDIVTALNDVQERYQRFSGARGDAPVIDSTMIGNHDMDRVRTRLGSEEQAKLAASILFTLPGTPFIYYGDELGQEGQRPDDNRREPFQWYAAAEGAGMTTMDEHFFNPSQYTHPNDGVSLEEQQGTEGSMYEHYKNLIEIRTAHPIFFTGTYTAIGTDLGLYGYTVEGDEDYQLTVIHNQRQEAKKVQVVLDDSEELISGNIYQNGDSIELAPYQTMIIRSAKGQLPIEEVEVEIPEEDYVVTFRVTIPENTPDGEDIYLVGEFNNWNEADPEMIMEKIDEYTYEKTIEGRAFEMIEYKFTRGDWAKREQNHAGQDLVGDRQTQNRVYTFEEAEHIQELTVEKWSDAE